MPKQVLPPSLRESIHAAVERVNTREAILRYYDRMPLRSRGPDHDEFCARLCSEIRLLENVIRTVTDAWRKGWISLAEAADVLTAA